MSTSPTTSGAQKGQILSPFLKALRRISDGLLAKDLTAMKFVCQDCLPEGRLEEVTTGIDLFKLLIQKQLLSEESPDILYELLSEAERDDLLKKFNKLTGLDEQIKERAAKDATKQQHFAMGHTPQQPIRHPEPHQLGALPSPQPFVRIAQQGQGNVQSMLNQQAASRVHQEGISVARPVNDNTASGSNTGRRQAPDETPVKRVASSGSSSSQSDEETPVKQVYGSGDAAEGINAAPTMDDNTSMELPGSPTTSSELASSMANLSLSANTNADSTTPGSDTLEMDSSGEGIAAGYQAARSHDLSSEDIVTDSPDQEASQAKPQGVASRIDGSGQLSSAARVASNPNVPASSTGAIPKQKLVVEASQAKPQGVASGIDGSGQLSSAARVAPSPNIPASSTGAIPKQSPVVNSTPVRNPERASFPTRRIIRTFKTHFDSRKGTEINLREYQKELAAPGIEGQNYIICAPTGCGKTMTAAAICLHRHEQAKREYKDFKAIFIVPLHSLIQQQTDAFNQIFPEDIVQGISETENLEIILAEYDVVVLTAQILLNALNRGSLHLTDLSMLMFDECHHTTLNHPYNEVMKRYLAVKHGREGQEDADSLPQIIGLSASLGVGGDDDALDHVKTLAASMDSVLVKEVRENIDELNQYVKPPVKNEIMAVPGRDENDMFIQTVVGIMRSIERLVFGNEKPSHEQGSQQYENWIVLKKMDAEKESRRAVIIACRYLREFNTALIYYDDLRAIDALDYLDEKLFHDDVPQALTQIEKRCIALYREKEEHLRNLSMLEELDDIPKLTALVERLVECYQKNPDSRGIILSKTRAATTALVNFVREETKLRGLVKVDRLVGQGKEEDGYMTDVSQQTVIRSFKEGKDGKDGCNLLIATDVAQEGLDIPECNFVIRYNFVSNEIGTVQARGRARAMKSECYLILQSGSKVEQRELKNQEREEQMKKALDDLNRIPEDQFWAEIKARQLELIRKYEDEKRRKKERQSTHMADEVEVVCKECNNLVCNGSQLIRKGTHFISTDPAFMDRVEIRRFRRAQVFRDTDNTGVVFCGNQTCNVQYGPLIRYKRGVPMETCALSCKSMLFRIPGVQGLTAFRTWSKCTFPIDQEPY
ncbi:ATP-dependent RNA helicase DHX58-like [Ptychodera flava]|uniref:ATP-dependent RNA helicase DHX58-like n=1 Tax=Ptychodera flava TaxID=63121 RepID=UPI00396A0488